ncbi:unannotated protein [freshwater metagenome]|uniref:Unannotated protein n=1 Tax=freshwater metagenome TaxID=449393 RepID=A0A6J7XVM1_9ZZZZ
MKSIPTREILSPSLAITDPRSAIAKASGGVTTETYVVPARPKRTPAKREIQIIDPVIAPSPPRKRSSR